MSLCFLSVGSFFMTLTPWQLKLRRNKWQLSTYIKIKRVTVYDFRDIEEGSQLAATWSKHRLIYCLLSITGAELCYSTIALIFSFFIIFFLFQLVILLKRIYFTIVPDFSYLKFRWNRNESLTIEGFLSLW